MVELRCIEAAKHASDVGNYYVLQILYSTNNVPNAADDTLPTARDSQLFKFNKYTTVRDVMTTVGFKLEYARTPISDTAAPLAYGPPLVAQHWVRCRALWIAATQTGWNHVA